MMRRLGDYSILFVLLGVCAFLSWATYRERHPNDPAAGAELGDAIARQVAPPGKVLIVVRAIPEDAAFADAVGARLKERSLDATIVRGEPADAREELQRIAEARGRLDAIAANQAAGEWAVLREIDRRFPSLGDVPVFTPSSYRWPAFLTTSNLLNVANQIVIIAILAIGMTMVIVAGGIDLSVGSLISLSAVTATLLIREVAGAEAAQPIGMALCCAAAILLCMSRASAWGPACSSRASTCRPSS